MLLADDDDEDEEEELSKAEVDWIIKSAEKEGYSI